MCHSSFFETQSLTGIDLPIRLDWLVSSKDLFLSLSSTRIINKHTSPQMAFAKNQEKKVIGIKTQTQVLMLAIQAFY